MSHYVLFYFISFSFICNVCNVWMLYKRERERERETKKWGRGVNCEEEIREKNEMGEGGCMCVVGEKKKEKAGVTWVVGKRKRGKKEMGSGIYVYGGKKGGVEKKERKKF